MPISVKPRRVLALFLPVVALFAAAASVHAHAPQAFAAGVCSGQVPHDLDALIYLPAVTSHDADGQPNAATPPGLPRLQSAAADSHLGLRVAFVHGGRAGDEAAATAAYRLLLLEAGLSPYLLPVSSVAGSDFSACDAILIAADSGGWPEPPRAALHDSGLPILALGEGGANFLAASGLAVGVVAGDGQSDVVQAVARGLDAYAFPAALDLPADKTLVLYTAPVVAHWLDLTPLPTSVEIGSLPNNPQYTIAQLEGRYGFWGYEAGPERMTQTGKSLFLNTLAYVTQGLQLPLQARRFAPDPGIEQSLLDALAATDLPTLHAYVQLDAQATEPACADPLNLRPQGVAVGPYLAGQSHIAAVAKSFDPQGTLLAACVRWLGMIPPADKAPAGGPGDQGPYLVHFHFDVTHAEAEAILFKYSATAVELGNRTWRAPVDPALLPGLLAEDRVRWVEAATPPQPTNDVARDLLGVDELQTATVSGASITYAGLDGSGVTAGVFDNGFDSAHPDFAGRVLTTSVAVEEHGTHVAGILGGSGVNSADQDGAAYQWRGMAPGVQLALYDYLNGGGLTPQLVDEAINTFGMRVSNFSVTVSPCEGRYDTTTQLLDGWIHGDLSNGGTPIPPHTLVTAAGNEGSSGDNCVVGERGFHSLTGAGKNMLVVGGVLNDGSNLIYPSSSRGPTYDGRLKPDVLGVNQIRSTVPGGGYAVHNGTSMASPSVAGVVALMLEQYALTNGAAEPLPSSLRALLIQHALDLVNESGTNGYVPLDYWEDPDTGESLVYYQGPDYSTGYGLVNAPAAVEGVAHKEVIEGQLANAGDVDEYPIEVIAFREEVRFTLVWDDYPADAALAGTANHLVSDLDLVLVDPNGGLHYPWALDPLPINSNFTMDDATPAYRGEDHRNNVEQVVVWASEIDDEDWSGQWTVRVRADALPQGAQSYSLVGEWREISLPNIYPLDAGHHAAPDAILIPVRVQNPHLAVPNAAGRPHPDDWRVQIGHSGDWTDATVQTAWGPVGDQLFLVVQPPDTLSPGSYHLAVWLQDEYQRHQRSSLSLQDIGVAIREDAIILGDEPSPPVDEMIVVDNSGSMAAAQKLDSAQNAARAFVDLRRAGDQIGVVTFGDNADTPYGLTLVSPAETELGLAKLQIDLMSASGYTAMGAGMSAAKAELDAHGLDDHRRHIVLLGDGLENVPPCWDTTAGADACQGAASIQAGFTVEEGCPAITVDTVVVGPEDASWADLMAEIADATCGRLYNAVAAADDSATVASGAFATGMSVAAANAANTGPAPYFPRTLQNSLSDIYQVISNENAHQRRLWEEGNTYPTVFNVTREITLPAGLDEVTFAVNWSVPQSGNKVRLYRPSGVEVFGADADAEIKLDDTHTFFRLDKPAAGVWKVRYGGQGQLFPPQEILLTVAAPTDVQLMVELGLTPSAITPGVTLPIHAVLVDQTGMITGAVVSLAVVAPGGVLTVLSAHDDGLGGDHTANDGVYTANYAVGAGGIHQIKAVATGTANDGAAFTRYQTRHFLAHARPLVLYLYSTDSARAEGFASLLEATGMEVETLVRSGAPPDLSDYDLLIVGPETGAVNGTWNDAAAWTAAIVAAGLPVIGAGEGGYALFGALALNTGFPHGSAANGASVLPTETAHPVWNEPYDTDHAGEVALYTGNSPGMTVQGAGVNVLWLGAKPPNSTPLWITLERGRFLFWGFNRGPAAMTAEGKSLFVNAAWHLVNSVN